MARDLKRKLLIALGWIVVNVEKLQSKLPWKGIKRLLFWTALTFVNAATMFMGVKVYVKRDEKIRREDR